MWEKQKSGTYKMSKGACRTGHFITCMYTQIWGSTIVILGPMMFVLLVNNFLQAFKCSFVNMHADGTTLYVAARTLEQP